MGVLMLDGLLITLLAFLLLLLLLESNRLGVLVLLLQSLFFVFAVLRTSILEPNLDNIVEEVHLRIKPAYILSSK